MNRFGDEAVQVQEWAYATLSTDADLAVALDVPLASLGDRVWPDVAPSGTDSPWVVFSTGEALDTQGLGDQPRLMTTVPLIVKVVGQVETYSPLAGIARALFRALDGVTSATVADGGVILTVKRTGAIQYPEDLRGIQYRHLGHTLQVNVQ